MPSKTATCERTGVQIPVAEGFFVADPGTAEWSFMSREALELHGGYNISASDIVKSPEALVDWIAQLNDKTWFDSKRFVDFFTRFRKANKIYFAR